MEGLILEGKESIQHSGDEVLLSGMGGVVKDSIYNALLERGKIPLQKVIRYTTRQKNISEEKEDSYYFLSEESFFRYETSWSFC